MATTSNLASIKDVIIYAHDELHNKRALSVKDFEDAGSTQQAHTQWTEWVKELKAAVDTYNDVTQAQDTLKAFKAAKIETQKPVDTKEKAIEIVTGKVLSAWRSILKVGTEEKFDKRFFIYDTDLAMVAGFCGLHTTDTAVGRQFSHKAEADFRKQVEMCIGIRLAGNGMLSDATRDLIVAYESAVKKIDANKAALNDSKDNSGKTVAGYESSLKLAIIELEEMTKMYDEVGISAEQKVFLLKNTQAKVDDLTKKVKDAKEAIEDAEKIKNKNEKAYDKAIALLKSAGLK